MGLTAKIYWDEIPDIRRAKCCEVCIRSMEFGILPRYYPRRWCCEYNAYVPCSAICPKFEFMTRLDEDYPEAKAGSSRFRL